jgi:SAM-dependent MidA family methyltransferase
MSEIETRLRDRIRRRGAIPFAEFMEEALYGPHGYYARQELPIGKHGDYVTGSSLSPLFGRCTARLLERLDGLLPAAATYLEAGYGTGSHLRALLGALGRGERRLFAWDRISRPIPTPVEELVAPQALWSDGGIEGLVFSYELFDALPVHRLIVQPDGTLGELWVEVDEKGAFRWRQGELSSTDLQALLPRHGLQLVPGQIADLAPGWAALYRDLARCLARGLLVTCDYGFETPQLLDHRIRRHGTLACYTRHRVHRDPFVQIGEQDLTAHVDFSALIRMGEEEGLETFALTRQARWLTACGLFEDLRGGALPLRQQAMALLDPNGMGEEIRVLVQGRGLEMEEVLDPDVLGRRTDSVL